MRHLHTVVTFLLAVLLAGAVLAADQPLKKQPSAPILPKQFAGWQIQGTGQTSQDPGVADPVNAAVLNEYGFTDLESAIYTRDGGHKLTLKAARFEDASGAYGAFTFYKQPQMLNEKIGDQASSLNNRILLYRANILVDAIFNKLTVMSAAELRELTSLLPLPPGNARNLPSLPTYLPRQSYVKNAKYVMGPTGLLKVGAPLPAQVVGFKAGAEVMLGNYDFSGGEATLMLISYPTPQIAAEYLRRIDVSHSQHTQQEPGTTTIVDLGPFFAKRTGPIVAVAAGPLSQSEAKSLLASVNYDADVTWNENTFFDKKNNVGTLVFNALILAGILMALALVAGVAFGGVRILIKRIFPDRLLAHREDMEFISLGLD
ncbi:MAG: hypothetical protein DMG72_13275, partial [Acidobacteria bacterium]